MSGKSVLFATMAALLILLALGQSIALHLMSTRIAEQINEDSKNLSKQMVELVTTRALRHWEEAGEEGVNGHPGSQSEATSHSTRPSQPSAFIIKEQLLFSDDDKLVGNHAGTEVEKTIRSDKDKESSRTTIIIKGKEQCVFDHQGKLVSGEESECAKQNIKTVLDEEMKKKIHLAARIKQDLEDIDIRIEERVNSQYAQVVVNGMRARMGQGGANYNSQSSIEFSSEALTLVEAMKNWNYVIVVVFAGLGLFAAYGISHYFNQPLRALAQGYRLAGKGQLATRLQPQGVKEFKKVFEGFNQMLAKISQLQQQEEKVKTQAHLAEVGEVARGLAHALRNPIHAIGLNVEKNIGLLEQKQTAKNQYKAVAGQDKGLPTDGTLETDAKVKNGLLHMKTKLAQMDRTIQSILTLSASGVRRDENVKLLAVIQDIMLEIKTAATKTVQFDYSQIDPSLSVTGAVAEWRSMLHALVVNAVDASPENGIVVLREQREKDGELTVVVQDQGEGVDDSIMGNLFQAHVTTKAEGSGMGLYITERIARLFYDGRLELSNREDGGCEAKLTVKINE